MKKETEKTSAKSRLQVDPASSPGMLSVEIRVREQGTEALAVSQSEVAVMTAAQGWRVRLMVLGAVLAIAAACVGARIGSGWVPADDGILSQSALRVMQG